MNSNKRDELDKEDPGGFKGVATDLCSVCFLTQVPSDKTACDGCEAMLLKDAEGMLQIQEEVNRSFEEDISMAEAETKEFNEDSRTEQDEIAIEEQAEDDPFLKAELEEKNAETGEIPDAYPFNEHGMNASILAERESEESRDSFQEERNPNKPLDHERGE